MNIEINGNLSDIKGFKNFMNCIMTVYYLFYKCFGEQIMSSIDLYVDNATENSGYTPVITPIFKKYLTIKLCISDFSNSEQIVYQFSHELCHYVFYSIMGLDKKFADKEEENICSAMSLVIIKILFPEKITKWKFHVKNISSTNYRDGLSLAENINYDLEKLKEIILKACENKENVET